MGQPHIKVFQQWQRHFAAPVALMRSAGDSGDILAVDEDGGLYLLNAAGTSLIAKQLPWMPVAAGLSAGAQNLAVISPSGSLFILDRNGNVTDEFRTILRPTGLDMSPAGDAVAIADGAGKTGVIDLVSRKTTFFDVKPPYYYARFAGTPSSVVAVGQFGQVLYYDGASDVQWQKDYHCHTRLPVIAFDPLTILVPSPHYGIISLGPNGTEKGLFEVPEGPKALAVTADGKRMFVFNEKNELIIFESTGRILFRQPLGVGVQACECGADGSYLVAVMTTGALERFAVGEVHTHAAPYLEFAIERSDGKGEGPSTIWRTKVFSALGGSRWGQVAVTPSARYVALLDVDTNLKIFDQTGKESFDALSLKGREPAVKASRCADMVVAASSDNLVALDMRGYRQRRLSLKNEWTTHFDIAPKGIFFAVADFFRGVSLFDETLDRVEYLETNSDVLDIAVDGNHHTAMSLADGTLAFYTERGSLIRQTGPLKPQVSVVRALGQGFLTASGSHVHAFSSDGAPAWSLEVPGEVNAVQPTRTGIVVSTLEGDAFVTNAHGAVIYKMLKRAVTRYFAPAGDSKEILSAEYRGRLLTARSTESGVLWRREMDDDILAMEVSPDGSCIAVLSGIYLCLLSTATGPKPAARQVFLEI